jgi:hypothetical protein
MDILFPWNVEKNSPHGWRSFCFGEWEALVNRLRLRYNPMNVTPIGCSLTSEKPRRASKHWTGFFFAGFGQLFD